MAMQGTPGRFQALLLAFVLFVFVVASGMGYYVTSRSIDSVALFLVGLFIFTFSFLNKIWALYFLVFAMMFSPEFQIAELQGARQVTARVEDFLILVIMAGWLANISVDRNRTLFRKSVVNMPIIIYIQVLLVATLLGVVFGHVDFFKGFFYTLKYIQYFLLFFFVLNTNLSTRQLRALVALHMFSSLLLGIFGISQIGSGGRVTTPFEGGPGEPGTMGGFLVLVISICMGFVVHSRTMPRRIAYGVMAAVLFPPLLFTLSRGSYVAFAAAYACLFLLSLRKPIFVLGMVALFAVAVPLMPGNVVDRVTSTFHADGAMSLKMGELAVDESFSLRLMGYERAFQRLLQAPFFGFGVKGAGFIDGQYLLVLAETGIAGFVCFIWINFLILRHVYRLTIKLESDLSRSLAVGFLAGHVGLLVHALGANTFIIIRIMEPFWFLFALLCHFEQRDAEIVAEERGGSSSVFDRRAWLAEQHAARKAATS